MKLRISGALMLLLVAGCERMPETPTSSATAPAAVATPAEAPPAIIPTAPPAPAITVGGEELTRARALKSEGKLAEARDLLRPLADQPETPAAVIELLNELSTQILFTPSPAPEKVDYTIVAGDSLAKLAKQFNTTIELIKKSNNLTSDLIRIGNRLRIYQGQLAVVTSKTANTLTVTDHGKFLKRYRVGTGEYSKTPVGTFKITFRQEKPVWHRGDKIVPFGDPENILGTHWLGLDIPGYGIHGTWDNSSIGQQATAGCIRLTNEDVAELYTLLPVGTPVTIHE
jgi:lipoprotein-anchoring transpeptidase ErfK/SrfK